MILVLKKSTFFPIINIFFILQREEGRSRGRKWEKGTLQK